MIESALIKYLNAQLSVDVFPYPAPANSTVPVISVDHQGTARSRTHGENGTPEAGMIEDDFEVTVWATSRTAADKVRDSIIGLLESYQGRMSDNSSPVQHHIVSDIKIVDTDQDFVAVERRHGSTVFITVSHQ